MTLQQLKYILAISSTGSMNKAAEQLYVSQPSLTSSVQELEKEIGIKIFHRSGRGVTLTNDGAVKFNGGDTFAPYIFGVSVNVYER